MLGDRWTNATPIVRISLVGPAGLFLVGPLVRKVTGNPISLGAAVGSALVLLAWLSFCRVTLGNQRL